MNEFGWAWLLFFVHNGEGLMLCLQLVEAAQLGAVECKRRRRRRSSRRMMYELRRVTIILLMM
jgi:hypothetical protein